MPENFGVPLGNRFLDDRSFFGNQLHWAIGGSVQYGVVIDTEQVIECATEAFDFIELIREPFAELFGGSVHPTAIDAPTEETREILAGVR